MENGVWGVAFAFPLLMGKMLLVGLAEKDPLTAALDGLRSRKFGCLHFLVGWEGEPPSWQEPFGFDVGEDLRGRKILAFRCFPRFIPLT
jgi:hypothetical protein